MKIGYARCSSVDQNLDRQLQALKRADVDVIYQEKESGATTERPQLKKMLNVLKPNDIVIIQSLDRLSRSYDDIISLWKEIGEKGAFIQVLDMPLLNTSNNNDLGLTSKLISDIVLQLLAYVSQMERDKIKERQRQGIAIARSKGIYKGRKPKFTKQQFLDIVAGVNAGKMSVLQACRIYQFTSTSYYRLKQKYLKNDQNIIK